MEKYIVERRVKQMEAEGVTFHCNVHVGRDLRVAKLERDYDAVLLAGGAEHPRDLAVPGRDLAGIHFAMNFLPQQNRRISGEPQGDVEPILAEGKQVVVIGGGDTGSDCIGTSFRQGAVSVTQLEIMPQPPEQENKALTWPNWPLKLRTSSSQAEGAARDFAVATTKFIANGGQVSALECIRLDGQMKPMPGTEFQIPADLVLLAMGFLHPVQEGMVKALKVELDPRGNVKANELDYSTTRPKVFAAGDMRRGQSLVVWAIREGRQAAHAIDKFLMGKTDLPR
jgi:glutamate synthase (NADPH/NADH) small chain